MQKIAREFNFGETAFVLLKNDPNTYRVRILSPRTATSRRHGIQA
jgi:predicted PhzF superfamily epimerase YddE/YHI9